MKGGCNKSSGWMLHLVVSFLMQQILSVSAIYNMQQTCANVATTFIANPNDCTSYGYCKNGLLVDTGKCPEGHIYNTRKAMCDYPSANGCAVANASTICSYKPDNTFTADPNNCNRYIFCSNGVPEYASCPTGQIFDEKQIRCVRDSQKSNTCMANSICRLVPDNVFAGDADNCGSSYYSCFGGVGTPGKCREGTYYNKVAGGCQFENSCQTTTPANEGPGVNQPLPNNPDACKGSSGTPESPEYRSDNITCFGFYICSPGGGIWSKCKLGLHFNGTDCVTPFTYRCPFDRCGNIDREFVGAVGEECHNYLFCKNQVSQAASSGYTNYVGVACDKGKYFNEFTASCQDTSPASANYKLCT